MNCRVKFDSTVNRSQLKYACTILLTIIPEMLQVYLWTKK